jgi:hypothetical protein
MSKNKPVMYLKLIFERVSNNMSNAEQCVTKNGLMASINGALQQTVPDYETNRELINIRHQKINKPEHMDCSHTDSYDVQFNIDASVYSISNHDFSLLDMLEKLKDKFCTTNTHNQVKRDLVEQRPYGSKNPDDIVYVFK